MPHAFRDSLPSLSCVCVLGVKQYVVVKTGISGSITVQLSPDVVSISMSFFVNIEHIAGSGFWISRKTII